MIVWCYVGWMGEVNIRESRPGDVDAVYSLVENLPPLTQHTKYTYWNLLRNFSKSCFVAEKAGSTVGFITSHSTTTPEQDWFIWQVGVLPELRGRGLVDKLQDRVVDIARRSGAHALTATIEADNMRSLGSFSRLATRLGSAMTEIERFSLSEVSDDAAPEILYRIPLQG